MTKLQRRIQKYADRGLPPARIATTIGCSETHVRNTLRISAPAAAMRSAVQKKLKKLRSTKKLHAALDLASRPGPEKKPWQPGGAGLFVPAQVKGNGHLTLQAIKDKANDYLRRAQELNRAAEALEVAGLLS